MTTARLNDPEEEDGAVQVALLHHVLDEHPAMLRQSDLIREFACAAEDWAHHDLIERAIRDLVKRGLFDYLEDYVLPTRPAVYCRAIGAV